MAKAVADVVYELNDTDNKRFQYGFKRTEVGAEYSHCTYPPRPKENGVTKYCYLDYVEVFDNKTGRVHNAQVREVQLKTHEYRLDIFATEFAGQLRWASATHDSGHDLVIERALNPNQIIKPENVPF